MFRLLNLTGDQNWILFKNVLFQTNNKSPKVTVHPLSSIFEKKNEIVHGIQFFVILKVSGDDGIVYIPYQNLEWNFSLFI